MDPTNSLSSASSNTSPKTPQDTSLSRTATQELAETLPPVLGPVAPRLLRPSDVFTMSKQQLARHIQRHHLTEDELRTTVKEVQIHEEHKKAHGTGILYISSVDTVVDKLTQAIKIVEKKRGKQPTEVTPLQTREEELPVIEPMAHQKTNPANTTQETPSTQESPKEEPSTLKKIKDEFMTMPAEYSIIAIGGVAILTFAILSLSILIERIGIVVIPLALTAAIGFCIYQV